MTTTISIVDLLRLLDTLQTTRTLAVRLRVELEELLENKLMYVHGLEMFEGAREALEEARKAGL